MSATTSTASKDRNERRQESNRNTATEIKTVVKKKLGLGLGGKANNLKGKDQDFYGREASEETNKEMVNRGLLSYNKDTGGYTNVVNNVIKSDSNAIKYGASNSAMGSGDPTGAMTSIPISSKMLESQNRTKALILGGLSFAAPSIVGVPMRIAAGEAGANLANPEAAYADYQSGFQAKQAGKTYKKKRNVQGLVGQTISNAVNIITGKKKITGKSKAGGTILSSNNEEGLGN
tara:strand:+ start:3681 stop:4379 length:699 start_codon:yes stop_codon:yes gene_type:complete